MASRAELAALQLRFVPPLGLDRARPRDVRLTAGGKALVSTAAALLLAALAVGLVLQVHSVRQTEERRLLADTGVDVTAEVARLWRTSGEGKQPWVAYRFAVDGRVYESEAKVSLPKWRALSVGAPLPIRYVPANPSQSGPRGTQRRAMPLWVPYAASAAIALGGLACLFALRAQRQLLADGRAAPAIVTGHLKRHDSHGGTHRSITYEFPLLSGAAASGRSSTSSKPPAIGSVICVLYDPERPRRNMPYPLALVRVR